MENQYPELTLRDYMRVLFRQKAVVLTAFFTVMITVIVGVQFKTPVYEAQVKMLISAEKLVESPFYQALGGNVRAEAALTQSEIVNSTPVIDRTVAVAFNPRYMDLLRYELHFASELKKPFIKLSAKMMTQQLAAASDEQRMQAFRRFAIEDLRRNIKVEPVRDTNLFTITVRDYSPLIAAALANTISRSYLIFDLEQQVADLQMKYGEKHLSVMQLRDTIEKMTKELNGRQLPVIDAIGPASVKIIEQADVPLRPVGPSKPLIVVLAFFMSIFLGVMLAFTFEYMDQTFKSPQDIEQYLGVPYLGAIPKKPTPKAYHVVADQLYLLMSDKKFKALLVSTALREADVATIVVNVGAYLAKTAGHKVLLMDTNFRQPSLHGKFDLVGAHGLSDVLEGKATFDKMVKDMGSQLFVLPAGKTSLNPITLLGSHAMQELLRQVKNDFDLVILVSTEFIDVKDAVLLAAQVDAVALVVNEGRTRRQAVHAAVAPLKEKKVNVIGAILNERTYAIPKLIYDRV